MMIRTSTIVLLSIFTFVFTGIAGEDMIPAGDDGKAAMETAPAPILDDDSEFTLGLDGWMLQMAVEYSNSDLGLNHSAFLGLDDILSNMDWVIPLHADLRYKRLGFMPDLVALKMSGGGATPGPLFQTADIDITVAALGLLGYFRAVDQPNLSLDLLGGARYLYVDTDITLRGGPLGSALGTVHSESKARIWDGIVGLRLKQQFGDKFFYDIYGDIGAGDSELTWQVSASLGYNITKNFSAALGYRYLTWEEQAAANDLHLTASGPILYLNYTF